MADGLLNKASIILTPTGYKAGTLYNVAPIDEPYEDFDFARASVASRVNSSGLVEMVGRTLGSELVQNGDFSELGSELVVNGDWYSHRGAYFEITNNLIYIENDGNTYGGIEQSFSVSSGKNFQLKYTAIEGTTSTDWRVNIGSSQGGTDLYSKGQISDFTENTIITSTSSEIWIRIYNNTPTIGDNFSIDNVSVKEVDPNDYWTLGAGWSIADGKASYDNSGTASLTQSFTWESGKTYEIQFEVSDFTSNYRFDLYTGSSFIQSAIVTDKTTWKIYFVGDGGTIMRFRALTTGAFSLDNVSVKEIIDTNNIPRISYDSNGDNGHILLEPTSTNLITYSEDFSQSSWINTYTLTPNSIISPDGSLNAYTITLPSVNGNLRTNVSVSSSTDYIFSFYAKRGTASEMKYRVFDFTNLSDIVSKTSYYSQTDINNWVRIEVPFTTNATTSEVGVYIDSDSQGNGDFYAWGAQLEALSYATSYIPTLTGSTVTRATETANGAGSADLINSTEGVLYAEIAALDDDLSTRIISLSDQTDTNRINLFYFSLSNGLAVNYRVSGSTVVSFIAELSDITNFSKVAFKWKSSDFKLYVDGVLIGTNTNTTMLPTNTLNTLSFTRGDGSFSLYGKCKALAVFNEALSDTELENLTS
jgi:hypothetical protein